MRINVAQQLKSSVGESRQYTVRETTEDGFAVEGEAKFTLTNRSILVTGGFDTVVSSFCSRCLAEFDQPIHFEFEEEFFPTADMLNAPAEVLEGETEDEGFFIGEDNILDLREALRQNIVLNLPTKPVCHSECAGLCQKCGANLNYGDCGCHGDEVDPRWAPLRELLENKIL